MTDFFCSNILSKPLSIKTPGNLIDDEIPPRDACEAFYDQAEVDTYRRLGFICQG